MKPLLVTIIALSGTTLLSASESDIPWPVGVTRREVIYNAETNADPITGMKDGWVAGSGSTRQPKAGWWHTVEHGIGKTGDDRWILFAQEMNRVYLQSPGATFEEAVNFVELNSGFPQVAGTPRKEAGYWRGNTPTTHPYTWAPMMFEEGGVFYLFYAAPYEVAPGQNFRSCFVATSTTGEAGLEDWKQYDPDPGTAKIEPLFVGEDDFGFRDFHVIKVQTADGPKFYMYYITNPIDSDLGVRVSKTLLRISDSITDWPESTLQPEPAFDQINAGLTVADRLHVDYENPNILQVDDSNFFLFIGRHGSFPPDYLTNPDWEPIPLKTEVFWSSDGKSFDIQGPDLLDADGRIVNSTEIIYDDGKYYATHAGLVNDLSTYPFDCCPDGEGNLTGHSPQFQKFIATFEDAFSNVQILEIEFQEPTAAAPSWSSFR